MAYRRWPREKSCGNSWASFSPGENRCLKNLWFHRCFSQRSWLDISRLDHSWFELISSFVNCFWNLGGTSKRGCTCIHVICPYSTYSFMIHACFPFTPILFSIKHFGPLHFLKRNLIRGWVPRFEFWELCWVLCVSGLIPVKQLGSDWKFNAQVLQVLPHQMV